MTCEICDLAKNLQINGESADANPWWSVNPFQGQSDRPRFVIQLKSHNANLNSLTPAENQSLGAALGKLESAILQEPGVAKVYFEQYSETNGGHIHVHVIPRFIGETSLGHDLGAPPEISRKFKTENVMRRMRENKTDHSSRGLVKFTRAIINFWNSKVSLYPLIRSHWKRKNIDFAEIYVLVWFLVLAGFSTAIYFTKLTPNAHGIVTLIAFLFGTYRLVDIGGYTFGMMLNTRPSLLISVARSFLLAILNVFEIVLITFVSMSYLATLQIKVDSPGRDALNLVTGIGLEQQLGITALATYSICAAGLYITLAMGLGMVLSKVGETYSSL